MLRVRAKVLGLGRFEQRMNARGAAMQARLALALDEAAQAVQGEAQRLVADPPKTGRIYRKYMPRRTHQASAKGEAPATDTGTLIAGIVIDRADITRGRIIIASTAPYSRALEFGTRKMAPRPFLRRALRSMKGRVVTIFREAARR